MELLQKLNKQQYNFDNSQNLLNTREALQETPMMLL